MSNDNVLSVEDHAEDVKNTGSKISNYYKIDGAQSKAQQTGRREEYNLMMHLL